MDSGHKFITWWIQLYHRIYHFYTWLFCFTMIPPGYVGVVINPLGDDGVQQKELAVMAYWLKAPRKSSI